MTAAPNTDLLPVAEARAAIVQSMAVTPAEIVSLAAAHGRTLAEPAIARTTQPPFDASAMDGWAVRAADASAGAQLRAVGEAAAGRAFDGVVGPGEAVRIFTGAPVPEGADAILIQEDAAFDGAAVTVRESARAGRHIRKAGLDFRSGDAGLDAGRRLSPRDVALAAAMNLPWLAVRRRPLIAILATGDELARPGEPHGPDQITASNGFGLAALVAEAGGEALDLGLVADREAALDDAIAAATGADMLVTLGGASVGDHDLVAPALQRAGVALDFWRIAMRPGKPLMFGRGPAFPALGLPGNPVSAMVCAEIFLKPAIAAMLGRDVADTPTRAHAGAALRANDRREDYLRATLAHDAAGRLIATPFSLQDSSALSRLARADALIVRPPHAPAAAAGDEIAIRILSAECFGGA